TSDHCGSKHQQECMLYLVDETPLLVVSPKSSWSEWWEGGATDYVFGGVCAKGGGGVFGCNGILIPPHPFIPGRSVTQKLLLKRVRVSVRENQTSFDSRGWDASQWLL
ncbi:hypothetical protein CEXT_382791, partial [Caerostris extrusa]